MDKFKNNIDTFYFSRVLRIFYNLETIVFYRIDAQ